MSKSEKSCKNIIDFRQKIAYFINKPNLIIMKVLESIAQQTSVPVAELKGKPWKEIVFSVVLPRMAGMQNHRYCINDRFMELMAQYPEEIIRMDYRTGMNLLEIAMQRLSCGAVMHEPTPWPQPLDKEYWPYSSKYDEGHVMSQGCYNFIFQGLPECLKHEETKSHALKILFGLTSHLDEKGNVYGTYLVPDKLTDVHRATLYKFAKEQVEKHASFEEIFEHYARPGAWERHKDWFAQAGLTNAQWRKFFNAIGINNIVTRWRIRHEILNGK